MIDRIRRSRHWGVRAFLGLAIATLTVSMLPGAGLGVTSPFDRVDRLDTVDRRPGAVQPTTAQKRIVAAMGATARWNRFGTPQSLIDHEGFLATGLGSDPVRAARSFIRANKALFRLSNDGVANLSLLNDSKMAGGAGHAVLFRQTFGDLAAAQDGMIAIGVVNGKIAYASSSAVGDGNAPAPAVLDPVQAWLSAAADVGRDVSLGDVSGVREQAGWTVFDVAGFAQPQQARLAALPTPADGVKTAYEVNVLDVEGADVSAYTSFVDARTGAVLLRVDRVAELAPTTGSFEGTYGPDCGELEPITVPEGTRNIRVVASDPIVVHDIVLNLLNPDKEVVESADTLFSPEAILNFAPDRPGTWYAQVCPFSSDDAGAYVGQYETDDTPVAAFPYPPKWKYFLASPRLDYSATDNRVVGCWDSNVQGGSTNPTNDCDRQEKNLAARAPWDHNVEANEPTFTTMGNNAITTEAWISPFTPGEGYSPRSETREYKYRWDNQWFNARCNDVRALIASPQRNDIDAAIVSLFANHNRMHDWSYFLGFTEENYNLQVNNFGETAPGPFPLGREKDPEIGNAQAGALTGRPPLFLGRDNANQITLQDGVPGITNMYLWQPVAAGFYPPCVDGDFDMSVIGHEYTHAISNRMVGGPDSGLTSSLDGQARALGESYSDFTAVEYLMEHGYVPRGQDNPFAVGAYVTGNDDRGIRNYGMNNSPLNYSNVQGYDGSGGSSPHDDGEIWSATNYDIRKAFIAKYNGAFPASNESLQRKCAAGRLPVGRCPGNRRWIQLVFDGYLLMPPAATMLDARDALLVADRMRFDGANQRLLWHAFARRGFGKGASTTGTDDPQPKPSFVSPREGESRDRFRAVAADEGRHHVDATIYVGDYEGNVTPVADTDPSTPRDNEVPMVRGLYHFVVRAEGYGLHRFERFASGRPRTRDVVLNLPTNYASVHKGATVTGDGVNRQALIDDTESSNWAALRQDPNVKGTQVTVDLAGGAHVVRGVTVSALLRVPDPDNDNDPGSQNRFSALRQFAIEACRTTESNDCEGSAGYTRIYRSPSNAFPGGIPRPLSPNLNFKFFDVKDTSATHVRLVVLDNQCTGTEAYQDPFPGNPEKDHDDDVTNPTDCTAGSSQDQNVRAAELQVTSHGNTISVPRDPVVTLVKTGPLTAAAGDRIAYEIDYENLGPEASSNAAIIDRLPPGLRFVSATDGGAFREGSAKVVWDLGVVPVGASDTVKLVARVRRSATTGSLLLNQASFTADATVSTPAAWATLVR